jgi:L-ascorbate metabolism protein UlaG (beta-lactamase superfamily)
MLLVEDIKQYILISGSNGIQSNEALPYNEYFSIEVNTKKQSTENLKMNIVTSHCSESQHIDNLNGVNLFFTIKKTSEVNNMKTSPHFSKGKFHNLIPTKTSLTASDVFNVIKGKIMSNKKGAPQSAIPTLPFSKHTFIDENSLFAFSWFGHSSVLIKLTNCNFLFDPIFSSRASMVSWAGPKSFPYTNPLKVKQLPDIDAVILSHDHYDHMDFKSISTLKNKVKQYYVPLGVGELLKKWGIPAEFITELDWWESITHQQKVRLMLAPSRHFSGRSLWNRNKTLWGSWILETPYHKIFFGGDSGYSPTFKEIGQSFGPFSCTFLECGAYSPYWPDIHMLPHETAQAHIDLRGKTLIPIHWAKFNLALHPWKEPIEKLTKIAMVKKIQLMTPQIGETVNPDKHIPQLNWWKNI